MIGNVHSHNLPLYDFSNPIDIEAVSGLDPLFFELVRTPAFQRLKSIRFLGGIDYLLVRTPNGTAYNIRYTRYQHSLGVARLAMMYSEEKALAGGERRLAYVAALLHDIGHAPLSHSLEPVFTKHFGIDHHQAANAILRGSVPIGQGLADILDRYQIDVERVIRIISGEDAGYDCFFSRSDQFRYY